MAKKRTICTGEHPHWHIERAQLLKHILEHLYEVAIARIDARACVEPCVGILQSDGRLAQPVRRGGVHIAMRCAVLVWAASACARPCC